MNDVDVPPLSYIEESENQITALRAEVESLTEKLRRSRVVNVALGHYEMDAVRLRAEVALLRQHRDGHMPDCAGMDEPARMCGCGYLQGEAYRGLVAQLAACEREGER